MTLSKTFHGLVPHCLGRQAASCSAPARHALRRVTEQDMGAVLGCNLSLAVRRLLRRAAVDKYVRAGESRECQSTKKILLLAAGSFLCRFWGRRTPDVSVSTISLPSCIRNSGPPQCEGARSLVNMRSIHLPVEHTWTSCMPFHKLFDRLLHCKTACC